MATLLDSLVSSSARKMPIRKRPDLSAQRQQYLGRTYIVVKEPVGLNYYRFQEEEYAILQMLDGQTSLDEIKERFEAEFPPEKITLEELQRFLGMLHRSGLVIAGLPGQGRQLRRRRDERRRREILGAMTNVLCIRFKGFDPERVLGWLYPKVRWLFSPITLVLCLLLAASALTLVLVQFDVFRSKLPGFYQFFSVHNALWLAAMLAFTKVFHEFGHGLSCKHFGGECHEIGVMILVLTPCLYCNVSDSWMLPNKWHRAAIGAAGMYVELTLASIATFIWWFTDSGTLPNNLCLNVMFISSVSTILFNANPLLRYDGYYILSDVAEIPNLRQKATTILSRKLAQLCLGLEPPEDPFLPQRKQIFFALYSVAAAAYRWFILLSICWFLFQIFKPYGLQIIGRGIVLMAVYGLVAVPLYKVGKFFYVPGRIEKVKKPRMYTSLAVLVLLLGAFIFVPLPYSVTCSLEIQPRDAESIYVAVPGRLDSIDSIKVKPGQKVDKGDTLAELSNLDVELEIAQLAGIRDQYDQQVKNLQRQRFPNRKAGADIPKVKEARQTVENQLNEKKADRRRLRLVAPVAGKVLPPPLNPGRTGAEGQLRGWSGTPLDLENVGCYLEEGVLFCRIGDPKKLEAILLIDQADVEFVHDPQSGGQPQEVEIKLDELPHDTFHGEITELDRSTQRLAPKRLSTKAGGDEPTTVNPTTGQEELQNVSCNARVPLDDPQGLLRIGLRGQAKIHVEWQPLGKRFWRFLRHVFSFKL